MTRTRREMKFASALQCTESTRSGRKRTITDPIRISRVRVYKYGSTRGPVLPGQLTMGQVSHNAAKVAQNGSFKFLQLKWVVILKSKQHSAIDFSFAVLCEFFTTKPSEPKHYNPMSTRNWQNEKQNHRFEAVSVRSRQPGA